LRGACTDVSSRGFGLHSPSASLRRQRIIFNISRAKICAIDASVRKESPCHCELEHVLLGELDDVPDKLGPADVDGDATKAADPSTEVDNPARELLTAPIKADPLPTLKAYTPFYIIPIHYQQSHLTSILQGDSHSIHC